MSTLPNESSLKLTLVKQKIISSLLIYNYELISMCFAKIYSASAHSKTWLYTELEGGLTLVIDYARKSARFLLFDLNTFEIIFECEFYKNFNLFYTNQTETFQCFEVSKGFIGFQIPDKISAMNFSKSVSKLSDALIAKKIKEKIIPNKNDMKSNSSKVMSLLKEKLSGEYFFKDNVLTEKKLLIDLNNIEKIINMIEYDEENERFLVTGNTQEIEELVTKVKSVKYSDKNGLRITDRVSYAMEIYESTMNSILKTNELKLKKEEEERKLRLLDSIRKDVDPCLNKINNPPLEALKTNNDNKKTVTVANNQKGVPSVPQPPPTIAVPAVPKGVPSVPKGVPPVPKGIPPVPKGVPPVPLPSKTPATITRTNQPPKQENNQTTNNEIKTSITDNTTNVNENIVEQPNNATQPLVEENKPKRKEPKMDMMTELRMKLANRTNNTNTNSGQPLNPQISIITDTSKNIVLSNTKQTVSNNTINQNNLIIKTVDNTNINKSSENIINTDVIKPVNVQNSNTTSNTSK